MITGSIARSVLLVSAISLLMGSGAQAASITVNANGILLGAKDVIVNGALYDVAFIEGTCAEVFGACDIANFVFTTESAANAASAALFDQVLLDGALGSFDSDVTLTNGCGDAVMEIDQCFVFTPYGTFSHPLDGPVFQISLALNTADPNAVHPSIVDEVLVSRVGVGYDTRSDFEGVLAKWTAVPQSVPDHTSTVSLLGLSVALMWTMRRAG